MSLLEPPKPFLQTNAWQHGQNNSLRYNTSQAGSVLALGYGTFRQQVNLIDFGDYRGPTGKKGKSGPLPIGGQSSGKGKGGGGGGKKGPGGKKSTTYSVDVAFALCQGPVDIGDHNFVWSSAGVAFFQSVGLNKYTGTYPQAVDPVFDGLGHIVSYPGTCYVTGTPMDLGSSPVIPNLSFEISGFEVGTAGPSYPQDANPANIVNDFLTNPEHGAGWPSANLDPDLFTNYGTYCQAAQLVMSPVLQVQTEAATWVSELVKLTNTAMVWSGTTLKFIPYGDIELSANGATWTPSLVPEYYLTDDDFLPWTPHLDSPGPILAEEDPVKIARDDSSEATNWISIEYFDRSNFYNKNIMPQFDQASIDAHGLRTESSVQGNCFCNATSAGISIRLILQRKLYVRNKYKFQLGWRYMLLEPMDIVLITDTVCGLQGYPVRITSIKENSDGDMDVEAEDVALDSSYTPIDPCYCGPPIPPVIPPPPPTLPLTGTIYLNNAWLSQNPIADTSSSPTGTLSVWLYLDQAAEELPIISTWLAHTLGISISSTTGTIGFLGAGSGESWEGRSSGGSTITPDGRWHHLICAWDTQNTISPITAVYDGQEVPIFQTSGTGNAFDIDYSTPDWLVFMGDGGLLGIGGIRAGVEDYWFLKGTRLDITDPAVLGAFRNGARRATDLGPNGENPTGSPPTFFLHADWQVNGTDIGTQFRTNLGTGGTVLGPAGAGTIFVMLSTPY